MRWRRLRLEAFVRRLPSPSPPVQWRGEQLCAGQRAGSGVARQLCAARRGSCVPTPPSARGLRPSPLVSSPSGHQHDGAAMRWTAARLAAARWTAARARRRCATIAPRELRPPAVASRLIAAWTAARQGGYVLAPPLDSRRPPVASRLRRRLYSGAASGCALDSGAAIQRCAGADSRLEASVCRLPSLSPPEQRRGKAAMYWRHLSTRGSRLSPLVLVAACTAARLGSFALAPPLDSGPPSVASHLCRRLDSGGARQLWAGAALDSRRPSVASRLRRPLTVARRAAVRWTAARLGSCALAPLSTRGLHPPPHVSSPSGQRRGEAAVRCAARELCADATFGSRPPSVASRLIAVWTPA